MRRRRQIVLMIPPTAPSGPRTENASRTPDSCGRPVWPHARPVMATQTPPQNQPQPQILNQSPLPTPTPTHQFPVARITIPIVTKTAARIRPTLRFIALRLAISAIRNARIMIRTASHGQAPDNANRQPITFCVINFENTLYKLII